MYVGEINCDYDKLIKLFGQPKEASGDKKTSVSWDVMDKDEKIKAYIYDWKPTKDELMDPDYPQNNKNWNVGGDYRSLAFINNLIEEK